VVPAGVRLQREEGARGQRVPRAALAEEPEGEEHHQRKPLRAQGAEVRDLVDAHGRKREGGSGEQGRALGGPERAREEVRAERAEHEGEEASDVVEEDGVVGHEREREQEHGRAQHGLVHPERVAQGEEHVAVGQAGRGGEQGVALPADRPREERGVARVHQVQAEGQGIGEEDGEPGVEGGGAERSRAHYCRSEECTQPLTPWYVTFTHSPLTASPMTCVPAAGGR
jgi:hypothetical protein